MNMESLWEKTCALLSQDMPYVSYSTWVEGNMVPGLLENDTLFIMVKMERMISMIQNKYAGLIEKRLSETAGKPIRLMLLSREEMESRLEKDKTDPIDDNDPHLNPKYTFESFVVGGGNRFAHAAALAVAESPAEAYNPLFIYGGVGLGKTHLMQAIGHFIHQNDPSKKILYMTSENFTNQLISAIQMKKTYEFRERIRKTTEKYPYLVIEKSEDEYLTTNSADFHAHLGFTEVGHFHQCGYKFGRWYDMIWMEKIICS